MKKTMFLLTALTLSAAMVSCAPAVATLPTWDAAQSQDKDAVQAWVRMSPLAMPGISALLAQETGHGRLTTLQTSQGVTNFYLDELLIVPRHADALRAFLDKYNGKVVATPDRPGGAWLVKVIAPRVSPATFAQALAAQGVRGQIVAPDQATLNVYHLALVASQIPGVQATVNSVGTPP